MKIFITADIEGITGAAHWDETESTNDYFQQLREQMTAEVTAACEGALNAGATEIWIKDAHGWARSIIPAKLPREIHLIRSWSGHPFSMMQEVDDSFTAAMAIGYHSRAGSNGSPLAHTMTGKMTSYKINGQYASEFMISSYTASFVNVPMVFLSGDSMICEEGRALIPALTTEAVMYGVGDSTVSIHPHVAVDRIRAGVEAALKADVSKCKLKLPEHFSVELRYRRHPDAYSASFYPGASVIDAHTIGYETDNYFDVLRFFSFCV